MDVMPAWTPFKTKWMSIKISVKSKTKSLVRRTISTQRLTNLSNHLTKEDTLNWVLKTQLWKTILTMSKSQFMKVMHCLAETPSCRAIWSSQEKDHRLTEWRTSGSFKIKLWIISNQNIWSGIVRVCKKISNSRNTEGAKWCLWRKEVASQVS